MDDYDDNYQQQHDDEHEQWEEAIMNHTHEPQPTGGLADIFNESLEDK